MYTEKITGKMKNFEACNIAYETAVACREVNKGGLPMLYEMILETSGPEIKCALEVITQPYIPKAKPNPSGSHRFLCLDYSLIASKPAVLILALGFIMHVL